MFHCRPDLYTVKNECASQCPLGTVCCVSSNCGDRACRAPSEVEPLTVAS